jgi:hypothetical protein
MAMLTLWVACALTLLASVSAFAQVNVTTFHNDVARTGALLQEVTLTTSNLNVTQFGKLFERSVDDQIYGQPLYVSGVNIPVVGVRNVVYVATVNNSLYAFDADNPAAASPLWAVSYINPAAGVVPLSNTDVGQNCGTYRDFSGRIGIVGTPVIDPAKQTLYLVVKTKESGKFVQRLHAVDIRNGQERPGSPVVIEAKVPGTGVGSDAQHNVAFNALTTNQRSPLLLANGLVYIAWASYCDTTPYQGWVLGYDAASLQQVVVYNAAPNGSRAGIWSAKGLSADANGNVYAVTGNGSFDGDRGGSSRGNSFLKLSPSGALLDWFTPFNWDFLNSTDQDLGIQGALLVPNTNLLVGGGKDGVLYVLNRDDLGRFQSGSNSQIVQSFAGSTSGRANGGPIYWNSPNNGPVIYHWAAGDPLKVFRLSNGLFQTTPIAQSTALAPGGMPGGMLSLSANGNTPGTGLVWAALSRAGNANQAIQPGILRAYNASDVTKELWNSEQNAGRDSLGNFSKFSAPTIANGKVYVATFSNKLVAYGLLGTAGSPPPVGDPVPGTGSGLLAQYYRDPGTGAHFGTLVLTRTDPTVNFNWSGGSPGTGVPADNFSVRWTGQVLSPATGNYTFRTVSDDGVRLWVNGQLIINNWTDHSPTTNVSAPIALVAGVKYDIKMEYYERGGGAVAKLLWSPPGQSTTVIPQSQLFPVVPNQPPTVNAGPDQLITLPAVASLNGTATDDGLPKPPGALTVTWTKSSGREAADGGTVVFANPNALSTTATFGADGVYVLRLTVSDGAVTVSDDVTITVKPATGGGGTGLTGRYYRDPGTGAHFGTLVLTRTDPTVNFNWSGQAPGAGVTADNFSVRWTGQVQAPVTGNFTFSTVSDDGVRLWVNGQLIINNWTDHSPTTNVSAPIALAAGVKYDIKMEYYERGGGAVARLLWAYPGQPATVIPQSRLFP